MTEELVEILIIGAGPSGCVSASYLCQKGLNVKIIEKSKFPRYVIGESLIPRCMDHFEEAGLIDCLKEQQFEEKHGARFLKNGTVCNFDFSKKHGDGWNWTWQVPRDDFDNVLALEVQKKGITIDFENEVIDVKFDDSGTVTTVKDKSGKLKYIRSKFIIDSSGYGRVLPRLLDLDIPSKLPKHSSIFTQVKEINRPKGKEGTLITFDVLSEEVWFWVIPFSNGNTSIGFVGPTEFINSFQGSTTDMFSKILEQSTYYFDRFKEMEYLFDPILIQNYSKSVKQLYGKGYALTGNSSEFLDPIFSSGVSFATESGILAAKLAYKEINNIPVNWETEYSDYIKEGVAVFSSYVKEWYAGNLQKLFFHRPENPEVKKQICAVLAGYVWDKSNPFVRKHQRIISTMAHLLRMEEDSIEVEKRNKN